MAIVIRSAGFYNIKSARLKDFVLWLFSWYGGSLERMFSVDWQKTGKELLAVRGIGPETCDSMLLYAGNKPSFVVDAYTRRLFSRLDLIPTTASYEDIRTVFMDNLPTNVELFNEYHALIVEHCKRYCRTKPHCSDCSLQIDCPSFVPSITSA